MTDVTPPTPLLDAAGRLFYDRGVQSVGIDEIRSAAGVSLKRLYQTYPSKDHLVEAYLRRKDEQVRQSLAEHVAARESAHDRILAVYDWLYRWFSEPDYRGCAFVNAFGELGATSETVAHIARTHKQAVKDHLADLVAAAGGPAALADQLVLLVEGAITTAAISGSPEPARHAATAAQALLAANGIHDPRDTARTAKRHRTPGRRPVSG